MRPLTRKRAALAAAFVGYVSVLWVLWDTPLVYPLKIFVVLLHEISHGLAALATGGSIHAITVGWDQGGACYCPGGNAFLVLSAGYLGSLGWGLLMLQGARSRPRAMEQWLVGLGVLTLGFTLLYIRNPFGVLFGAVAGVTLVAARRLPVRLRAGVLTVLGVTSALYALLDIRSDVLQRPHIESDARMLADLTGIPTTLWGIAWILIGIAASVLFLRDRFRSP